MRLSAGLAVALVPGAVHGAPADYPSRPIRFVTTYPPGGSTDVVARMPAKQLRTRGSEPRATSPEELAKFMRVEHARRERVVKSVGVQVR